MNKVTVTIDGKAFEIDVNLPSGVADNLKLLCNGEELAVTVPGGVRPEQMEWIVVDGRPYEITVDPSLRWIKAFDGRHEIEIQDRSATFARPVSGDGRVKAPIPGLVTRVLVQRGDQVEVGQALLVLEAMKMENEIQSPRNGTVSELHIGPGRSVTLNELLIEII